LLSNIVLNGDTRTLILLHFTAVIFMWLIAIMKEKKNGDQLTPTTDWFPFSICPPAICFISSEPKPTVRENSLQNMIFPTIPNLNPLYFTALSFTLISPHCPPSQLACKQSLWWSNQLDRGKLRSPLALSHCQDNNFTPSNNSLAGHLLKKQGHFYFSILTIQQWTKLIAKEKIW